MRKNWASTPSTSWSYGRLADEIRLDFAILKILYRLNYLDFYFVYSSAILLIVLEVHFSLLFSNKANFKVCLWCVKSGRHCFSCRSLLLGTSAPNDIYIYLYIYILDAYNSSLIRSSRNVVIIYDHTKDDRLNNKHYTYDTKVCRSITTYTYLIQKPDTDKIIILTYIYVEYVVACFHLSVHLTLNNTN